MTTERRTPWMRVTLLALAGAILALFLMMVSPFPDDVLGDTRPCPPGNPHSSCPPSGQPQSCPPGNPHSVCPPGKNKRESQAISLVPEGTGVIGDIVVTSTSDQPVDLVLDGSLLLIASPAGVRIEVQGAPCAYVDGQVNVVSCEVESVESISFTTVLTDDGS